ncbi:hypothetical protein T484DRAFT_1796158, partial [Baffinella frigidus]
VKEEKGEKGGKRVSEVGGKREGRGERKEGGEEKEEKGGKRVSEGGSKREGRGEKVGVEEESDEEPVEKRPRTSKSKKRKSGGEKKRKSGGEKVNFIEINENGRSWFSPQGKWKHGGEWLIGRHVHVFWDDENRWFTGVVAHYDGSKSATDSHGHRGPVHDVYYEDGSFLENLFAARWQVLRPLEAFI